MENNRPEHLQDRLARLTQQDFEQGQPENPAEDNLPASTTEPETSPEEGEQ